MASDITSTYRKLEGAGKVMVFVHRKELAGQWFDALSQVNLYPEIEKADQRASRFFADVVIATPQTLYSAGGKRLSDWNTAEFGLLIIDELHHYLAPQFMKCVQHFKGNPNCKILGITATADRHDGKALGKIIDKVAFEIPIIHLIDEGWLVSPHQQIVTIQSLDLSKCKIVAGDFNQRELEEIVNEEKTLLGYADTVWSEAANKRTLVFCQNVKQAQILSDIFCRYQPAVSACISGKTPDQQRAHSFNSFKSGRTRILTNCAVFTEGTDVPDIQCVAMCKPTLSRTVYAQSVGRGLRPLTQIARNETLITPELRREAIRLSHKPNLLVLDFVGNSGRHTLQSTVDLLGGKEFSEEAKELAKKRIKEKRGGDTFDELSRAEKDVREEQERRKRQGVVGSAKYSLTYVDPFTAIGAVLKRIEKWNGHHQQRLSEKQRDRLVKNGWNPDEHNLRDNLERHTELIAASPKQRTFLQGMGAPQNIYADPKLTKWSASELIEAAVANGRKWPYEEKEPCVSQN